MPTRLSDLLASQVSRNCRARGYEYFASGAVRDIHVDERGIVARVVGNDEYEVKLAQDGNVLRASCTCPFFFGSLEICKHIWAAVVTAESRNLSLVAEHTVPALVVLHPVEPDPPPEGAEDDVLDSFAAGSWNSRVRASPPAPRREARPKSSPPPAWRQLLSAVAPPAAAPASTSRAPISPEQLIYVIDVAGTAVFGVLVIELMTRDRKINGEWSKPKPVHVSVADLRSLSDSDDREILERLQGARPHLEYSGYYGAGLDNGVSRVRVSGPVAREMLPLVCGTGRAFARVSASDGTAQTGSTRRWDSFQKPEPPALVPLAWDSGEPWRFEVSIRRENANGMYRFTGAFRRGDEAIDVTAPRIVLADGILLTDTHAARLDHGGAFGWLTALRRMGSVPAPHESSSAIIDALLNHPPPLADVAEELRFDIVDGEPLPRVRFLKTPRRDHIETELSFDYGGALVASDAPGSFARAGDSRRAIRRNLELERQHMDTLMDIGCRLDWHFEGRRRMLRLAASRMPAAVRTLLADGWHVETAEGVYRLPGEVAIDVSSGIDWFDLHGSVDYDGRAAPLPRLLAALERGEEYVPLPDGSLGLLPEAWLRKHALIARLGAAEGDRIRFKPSQVALLDVLLDAQPQATWDGIYAHARAEIQRFDGIQPLDPPSTFTGRLRGYQREGLGWLTFLQRFAFGGCLADDMGLGKTVMVLALLDSRRDAQPPADRRPSLVVAPRSVVFNWMREAERFTPRLRVIDYTGAARTSIAERLAEADVVLTTYGTLRRDAPALSARAFDYVVLDESQAIKNAATASAKAARLLHARFRLALSGTPIENHIGELRSLFDFLNPGLFGRSAFAGSGAVDEDSIALLARGLRPFILRRTKEQVASELPPKLEQTLYCELEKPQRALYDELRDHYRRTLLTDLDPAALRRRKIQVLEALLRLRQAACHPGLIDPRRAGDGSAKLDMLMSRLRETIEEGHKALVFSQFTKLLAIVRRELDAERITYEYLDGRTRDRDARVDRFQTDAACPLFLISLKAGGVGLNLTAADSVFLLDPWWNPAVEAQAIDRTHRIGQTRHVFAYRLIATDTVESRVVELQQRKRRLADAILTASAAPLADLKREDLELLLS
jgi:superfamily II DNA or RNA helicase